MPDPPRYTLGRWTSCRSRSVRKPYCEPWGPRSSDPEMVIRLRDQGRTLSGETPLARWADGGTAAWILVLGITKDQPIRREQPWEARGPLRLKGLGLAGTP